MSLKIVTWARFERGRSVPAVHRLWTGESGGRPHAEFLTIALPGFEWLTVKGFIIGLVYAPIYNALQRRLGT